MVTCYLHGYAGSGKPLASTIHLTTKSSAKKTGRFNITGFLFSLINQIGYDTLLSMPCCLAPENW
ncbi:hypothetical protein NVI2019_OHEONHNH_01670 [Providencia alcalifaciens]|nr:hypothetical protein NVI2019_PLFLNFOB_01651 [Providencia alcalifaciens]CAG9418541.1 hypothetical protein NVI2019_OHEONHNH_01670 [Providencia alcalifaciens]CAG9422587.1 hypothetical protein NVI2019_KOLGMIGM_02166 [Providencia alcalifaciens]CAG9422697.1 hypothetical protein NVI2019_NGLDDFDA_02163 [Providencia alcalifaciens]CAG9423575.1 hypothetical protein NVI2019_OGMBKCAO_02166 [Providencia alcalifaciens]